MRQRLHPPVPRLPRLLRREPWLAGLVLLIAAADAAFCVVRYSNFRAGTDLTLFDQAVWHYSRFEAPLSTIKGFSLLGDHFHPTVAALAPLYWVWSDPRMLLIGACVLVACSVIPVFVFARRRLPSVPSYLIAMAYGVFWGIQVGVGYEFHESELAPLLIALAILFADQGRWGWFYVAIALILGVKEDLAVFVVFFGVYLLSARERRRGAALMVLGAGWYLLATRVAIPHFSPSGYTYWSYTELGHDLPSAVFALAKAPWRLFEIGLSPSQKPITLLYLLSPFLFLCLASRWFILAIPLLLERFLSTRAAFWGTDFHYSLTIAPVLAMCAADGLAKLARRFGARVRLPVLMSGRGLAAIAAAMLLVSVALTLTFSGGPPRELLYPPFYRGPSFAAAAERAIAHVPSSAPVTANDVLLTHLSHREFASEIAPDRPLRGYLIADLGEPVGQPIGNPSFAALGRVLRAELAATTPVYYGDGWLVARLPGAGEAPSNGVLAPLGSATARRLSALADEWDARFAAGTAAAAGCYELLVRADPAAPSCFVVASRRLRAGGQRLTATLADAARASHGPCSDLAARANGAIGQALDDLSRADQLGRASAVAALRGALATVRHDVDERDLPGRLDRFLTVCSPRGPLASPRS